MRYTKAHRFDTHRQVRGKTNSPMPFFNIGDHTNTSMSFLCLSLGVTLKIVVVITSTTTKPKIKISKALKTP